jgi:hypothetical protein
MSLISAPQCHTHYSPTGNGDVLHIVVHKNVGLSEIVSEMLGSDHIQIILHFLDHVRTRNRSDPADKFTDREQFQRLTSELSSPRIQINSREEADKVVRDFTASVALAYRLSTSKIKLLDLNKDLPGLESPVNISCGK